MSRQRIVHLILQLELGGAESMVVLQAQRLPRDLYEVEVWALDRGGGNVSRLTESGIPVRVLGKGSGFSRSALRRIRALLRDFRPDLLHVHNLAAARWAALATRGLGFRPVLVRTEHTFDDSRRLRLFVNHLLTSWCFDATLGVCERVTEKHRRLDFFGRNRYQTLANAIDPTPPLVTSARAREILRLPADVKIIMNVGNLRPAKNQVTLIGGFAELGSRWNDARLVIMGEGPLREELMRHAERLGVRDRVDLVGHRPDAADLLVAADVVVQSSIREGMPVSLLEAARSAKPIVATDVGGTGEFVQDGVTGWLVPPGNPSRLAAAIREALDNVHVAGARAAAARSRLLERHDIGRTVRRLAEIYDRLLSNRE